MSQKKKKKKQSQIASQHEQASNVPKEIVKRQQAATGMQGPGVMDGESAAKQLPSGPVQDHNASRFLLRLRLGLLHFVRVATDQP